ETLAEAHRAHVAPHGAQQSRPLRRQATTFVLEEGEHRGARVDPRDGDTRAHRGERDAPGAHAVLEDRPTALASALHVVPDVRTTSPVRGVVPAGIVVQIEDGGRSGARGGSPVGCGGAGRTGRRAAGAGRRVRRTRRQTRAFISCTYSCTTSLVSRCQCTLPFAISRRAMTAALFFESTSAGMPFMSCRVR